MNTHSDSHVDSALITARVACVFVALLSVPVVVFASGQLEFFSNNIEPAVISTSAILVGALAGVTALRLLTPRASSRVAFAAASVLGFTLGLASLVYGLASAFFFSGAFDLASIIGAATCTAAWLMMWPRADSWDRWMCHDAQTGGANLSTKPLA